MANLALISTVLVSSFLLPSCASLESIASSKSDVMQPNDGDCTGKWCVARDKASEEILQNNIDYCCSTPGVNCQPIWEGQPCHSPDTIAFHASVVMNLYYNSRLCVDWGCDFEGTGIITLQDPPVGSCNFPEASA
ncbi:hypothetical protein MRB53_010484 [Persea americana]|uniref:Uncharacterized protein n=1 Tax=Persea americana TaxID=3435 RepID=A0ACC2LS40_PERAE|nr:hypothetical protein MRB53_010484 [Persea americana]